MSWESLDVPVDEYCFLEVKSLSSSSYIFSESDLQERFADIEVFRRNGEIHFYWQERDDYEPRDQRPVCFYVVNLIRYPTLDALLSDQELHSTVWRRDFLTANSLAFYEKHHMTDGAFYVVDMDRGRRPTNTNEIDE